MAVWWLYHNFSLHSLYLCCNKRQVSGTVFYLIIFIIDWINGRAIDFLDDCALFLLFNNESSIAIIATLHWCDHNPAHL